MTTPTSGHNPQAINIAIIQYPQALPSSITFPLDIFHSASAAYRRNSPHRIQANIELITAASTHQPHFDPATRLLFADAHALAQRQNQRYQLIILPAIWRNPRPLLKHSAQLIKWLQIQYHNGANICAVGTASFLLAETGLLEARSATTHWFYFQRFEYMYPTVKLQRKHLITQAQGLYCAGSINALADLSIYFCERFFGREIALKIESQFSPEIRRPADQQLYRDDLRANVSDERVAILQEWIREYYAQPLTLAAMASCVQLSKRQLNRLFKQQTGLTPGQYLLKQRIHIAQSLLKDSNLKINQIAHQCGFEDASYFIRIFKRETQSTPQAYRERTRAKLFN